MDPVEEVALYEKKQKELAEKELARQRELQNPESSKETPPKVNLHKKKMIHSIKFCSTLPL